MPLLLSGLLRLLHEDARLCRRIDCDQILLFCELSQLLRPIIARSLPSFVHNAPERLSPQVRSFLMKAVRISAEECQLMWLYLRDCFWHLELTPREDFALRTKYVVALLNYGLENEIGVFNLFPPTRTCFDPACRAPSQLMFGERELGEARTLKITIFTSEFGAVPGFTTSYYCRGCHTRYYANYYVHCSATLRTYYHDDCPRFIQTSEHFYMEKKECERFAAMMCSAWTSGTNCARIFNTVPQDSDISSNLPINWQTRFDLDVDDVWNGFFIYSLLMDHLERDTTLILPHQAPSQADRLRGSLEARNVLMAGTGQEAWNHACDGCCWVFRDEDGELCQLRSVVVDGITVGCPCCSVHDCTIPLTHAKDRYCSQHQDLSPRCRIIDCLNDASQGFKTCEVKSHRELEQFATAQGKAMFQLKARLHRLRTSHTHNSLNTTLEAHPGDTEGLGCEQDDDFVSDGAERMPFAGACSGKPDSGNVKIRARFGRRRTHCEVICTASCGVQLGRATFFGSEAPNGIRNFLMCLFPTPASLPGVIWYDNACQLLAMLRNDTDPHLRHYFDKCALPVDVFHFKSKHKESDQFCGEHCNPARWPQLQTPDGKWRFNSSAAEQTNVWFGGYASIVREMRMDRYTFFLDEMIKRRNRLLIDELEKSGKGPYQIPRSILLGQ